MSNFTFYDEFAENATSSVSDYQAFEEFWTTTPEFTVYQSLKTFVPPFLVVFGCCGNGIVLLALRQHCIRSSSIGYYLTLLISCYIMSLVTSCGLEWISFISETALLTLSDSMCRILQFVYSVINHCPYWIIALMLTDRTVYVCCPFYSSSFCTVLVAKVASLFIFIGLTLINIHMMWTFELRSNGCNIDPYQKDFYTQIWPWLSATVNCYLPLLCIHILLLSTTIGSCMLRRQGQSATSNHHDHQLTRPMTANQRHVQAALLVSMTFIILINPSVILNLIQYSQPEWLYSFQSYAKLIMFTEMFQTLVWLNMSVAHIIYILAVPKLKVYESLRACLRRKHFPQSSAVEEDAMIQHHSPSHSTDTAI